jgi:hypothetical protein
MAGTRIKALVSAGAALLAAAGAAFAQSDPAESGPVDFSADLRAVDPGVDDVNPLGVGRVDFRADLAVPLGFSKVYELPPGPDGQRRFARRSGAVWVVFTRSDYIVTDDGKDAVPPPNSTMYIGEPPGLRGPDSGDALDNPLRVSTRQDLRAGLQLPSESPATRATTAEPDQRPGSAGEQQVGPAATVLTSEPYRAGRVRALLAAAAR